MPHLPATKATTMDVWKSKKPFLKTRTFSTTFTPMEREFLGNAAAEVSEALIRRCQSAPRDELAELTGMPSGHKHAPTDPALARLLPNFERDGDEEYDGDNSLLRSLHENDICRGKLENLQLITEALGPAGSVSVTIEDTEVTGWVSALNDIRLYYAYADDTSDDSQQPGDAEYRRQAITDWLMFVQDSLLVAVMGDIPGIEETS